MKYLVIKKRSLIAYTLSIIFIIILSLSINISGAFAVYYNQTTRKLPIYSVKTDEKKIAISFDCAWGTEKTDKLLKTLTDNNIKATFFMVEFWTTKYPDYVTKISDAGHEIGTHSSTHSQMSKLNETKIKAELESSAKAISDITGKPVDLFRAPYGDYNDRLITTAESMGYYTIQWDVDSLDWKDVTANDIALRVINRVKNGSIILCHNNAVNTVDALPMIFSDLKNKGYEFVTIGELIYKENYSIDSSGKQYINS